MCRIVLTECKSRCFRNDVDTSTDLISLRADQAFVALTPSLANGQGIVADWIVAKGGPQFLFSVGYSVKYSELNGKFWC